MQLNSRYIWDTPAEAMPSLLRHLPRKIGFYEPCAGAGVLAENLEAQGHKCILKSDISPRKSNIKMQDAIETIKNIKWSTNDIFDDIRNELNSDCKEYIAAKDAEIASLKEALRGACADRAVR